MTSISLWRIKQSTLDHKIRKQLCLVPDDDSESLRVVREDGAIDFEGGIYKNSSCQ